MNQGNQARQELNLISQEEQKEKSNPSQKEDSVGVENSVNNTTQNETTEDHIALEGGMEMEKLLESLSFVKGVRGLDMPLLTVPTLLSVPDVTKRVMWPGSV